MTPFQSNAHRLNRVFAHVCVKLSFLTTTRSTEATTLQYYVNEARLHMYEWACVCVCVCVGLCQCTPREKQSLCAGDPYNIGITSIAQQHRTAAHIARALEESFWEQLWAVSCEICRVVTMCAKPGKGRDVWDWKHVFRRNQMDFRKHIFSGELQKSILLDQLNHLIALQKLNNLIIHVQ